MPAIPEGILVLQNLNATYVVEGETTALGTGALPIGIYPPGARDERTFDVNETPIYSVMKLEIAESGPIPEGHLDVEVYDGEGVWINGCYPECMEEPVRAKGVTPGTWSVVALSHDHPGTAYTVTLELSW